MIVRAAIVSTLLLTTSVSSVYGSSEYTRIDSLIQVATSLKHNNNEHALEIAGQALDESYTLDYAPGISQSAQLKSAIFRIHEKYDSALITLEDARLYFRTNDMEHHLAYVLSREGAIYSDLGNPNKSIELLKKSLDIYSSLNDRQSISEIYTNMGVVFGKQQKYDEALDQFIKAYEIKLSLGEENNCSDELINISIVYTRMEEYELAKNYVVRAIDINKKYNNQSGMAKCYNSLGGIYNLSYKFDSAIFFYQKSAFYADKNHQKHSLAIALNNIANVQIRIKAYDSAKYYVMKALNIQDTSLRERKIYSLNTLIDLFGVQGKFDSAIHYAKKTMNKALKLKNNQVLMESSLAASKLYEEALEPDSALKYYKVYTSTKDKIYNDRKSRLFADQRVQLENLDKENKINLLQKQAESDHLVNVLLLVITSLSSLTIYFGYNSMKEKFNIKKSSLQKQKKVLEAQLEHNKSRLFKYTLDMIHKDNHINEIHQEIRKAENNDNARYFLNKISKAIRLNHSTSKEWDNFNIFFSNVHKEFYSLLKSRHSDLTSYELRLCALLKLNLNNKEIATILSIEPKSVKMASYRLKKKLRLDEHEKLSDYLMNIENEILA